MDYKKLSKMGGFSLLEMLISIAIISLILAVVVLNQGDFTDQFSLSTNASDLELQIRQAQVYGVSVKEFAPSSNDFTSHYGVSTSAMQGSASYFIFFGDRGAQNGIYDGDASCVVGGASECIAKFSFTRGVKVNQVCALKLNSQADCAPEVGRADITFNRPEPAANFSLFNSQGNQNNIGQVIGVRIELISLKGRTKSVYVYSTGQISVQ